MSAEEQQAVKQRKAGEQEKALVDKALAKAREKGPVNKSTVDKAREKGFVDKAGEVVNKIRNKITGRPR